MDSCERCLLAARVDAFCGARQATPEEWRAAYDAKVQDFARETLARYEAEAELTKLRAAIAERCDYCCGITCSDEEYRDGAGCEDTGGRPCELAGDLNCCRMCPIYRVKATDLQPPPDKPVTP
jgi:hypothetical protein